MARGVTETDVWTAADTLLLEGRRPTVEGVRQRIGRGSPNTVTPYLDTWFKGLGRRLQDPMAYAAASAVPEPIAAAATHFWEAALAAARKEVEASVADERGQLAREREELARQSELLVSNTALLEERRVAQEASIELARGQLLEANRQVQLLGERAAELEERAASYREEVQQLRTARDAERIEADAEARRLDEKRAAEVERHEAAERRWLTEVDRARAEAGKAQKALTDLEARHGSLTHTLQGRLESLTAELAEAEGELSTLRINAARASAHADALKRASVRPMPSAALTRMAMTRGPRGPQQPSKPRRRVA